MEENERQPWQVSGTTVYRLAPTGRYRKGAPVLENEFTIQISASHTVGATEDDARQIAEGIARWLNES